jgi:tetratricopeptide (TPR) repeat protein
MFMIHTAKRWQNRSMLATALVLFLSSTSCIVCAFAEAYSPSSTDYNASGNITEYETYTNKGRSLFESGQLSGAIEMFQKALKVAPKPSLPVIYNNLSVAYIRRGNYFADTLKKNDSALSDFRMASFYLDAAWLDTMARSELHQRNNQIAKQNISTAYHNLGQNPKDFTGHLNMAKALRMQGKFPEAIVEYLEVIALSPKNAAAAEALGDLYTVVNIPEKAQRYYGLLVEQGDGKTDLSAERYVHLANAQYKGGKVEEAVKNYDRALALSPNNPTALSMLEKIWLEEIRFNPASVLGHANLGGVYQKKKQYQEAYEQYSTAEHFADQVRTTDFNTKKLIRLNMGTLFQEQKRPQPALKAYDTVLQVEPDHLLANYYKATLLEETGNLGGAITLYNKVLSIDPNHTEAREKMLALIQKDPDPKRSATGLENFASRFPKSATIQAQIGEEFHHRKVLDKAIIFYERALQNDPGLASAWANLGAAYQEQGNTPKSIEAFNKAVSLEPGNETYKDLASHARQGEADTLYQKAIALQQAGKSQEAIAAFRQVLAVNKNAEVYAAYGISLQSAGELDQAIATYQSALKQAPHNPDYLYYIGTAYHQKKEYALAKGYYEKTLLEKPDYSLASEALASIKTVLVNTSLEEGIKAYDAKQYVKALTKLDATLANNPKNSTAHYYKGLALEAQNNLPQAIISYQKSVEHDPDFGDGYYALAVALDSNKKPKEAKVAFEKFIRLSGNQEDDFTRYAKQRLTELGTTTQSSER